MQKQRKEEREAYKDKADTVILDIEYSSFHERLWAIDGYRAKYQSSPSALNYLESKIEAYITKKMEGFDDNQRLYNTRSGNDRDFYLGQMFYTLISIGKNKCLQELIASGVDVEANIGLSRPLHLAAKVGNIPAMEMLIHAGAGVNTKDTETNTPLYCCSRNADATSLLLSHGANPNIFNIDGNPPWFLVNGEVIDAYSANGYSFS